MTAQLSRRSLLQAAPVIAAPALMASPVVGASAVATTSDSLPGLQADCERCRQVWLAVSEHSGEDTPEDKTAWEAFMDAEKAIETTVASTPEGVAAQIRYQKESYVDSSFGVPDTRTEAVPVAFLDVILEGLGRISQ